MSEFSIIDDYFKPLNQIGFEKFGSKDLGIGDDGAVLSCPAGHQLVVVTDTLIDGVHFPKGTRPFDIAWKALAVNLSDLAAMGAEPAFYSLALSLPKACAHAEFLEDFAEGLRSISSQFGIPLVGGDTTRSDCLALTITAQGWLPEGKAVVRSGAQVGDQIYVSGCIGDGALALESLLGHYDSRQLDVSVFEKFNRPIPHVQLGCMIQNKAHAAIDISDGLLADLGHILEASDVSAHIDFSKIPFSDSVKSYLASTENYQLPISGGDDYELCFTMSVDQAETLKTQLTDDLQIYCIGEVCKQSDELIVWRNLPPSLQGKLKQGSGFQHF